MNSAPLLDRSGASPLAGVAGFPSLPASETPAEPFGAILEEATAAEPDISECETEEGEVALPIQTSEEPEEEMVLVAPLVCFCPPPDVRIIPLPVEGKIAESAPTEPETPPVEISATTTGPGVPSVVEPAIEGEPITPVLTRKLTEIVQPKTAQSTAAGAPQLQSNEATGAIKLDPALFESVNVELPPAESAKIVAAQGPDLQRAPVASASHGTLVAQLENRVKNHGKSAEIAPAIEQKMPVRDLSRRIVAEVARAESFHAGKESSHSLTADFQVEAPAETIPVKSLEAARLVETIRTEVTSLRQRGDIAMSVVLKPDTGTQLILDVSIARDGTIQAQARCERGDFQNLQSQWPQLQQSLATHGIRMADLSNNNHSQQHHNHPGDSFQNFDRGQNPQQRSQRDLPSFEDQLSAPAPNFSSVKPNPQPAAAASSTRRWQSWA